MMKNKLLIALLSGLLLCGCTFNVDYTPSHGGKYDYTKDQQDEGEEEEEILYATYNFYFSYSDSTYFDSATQKNVKCPIYSVVVPMMEPMGKYPEALEADTTYTTREAKVIAVANAKAAEYGITFDIDPVFNKFVGFSYTGVAAFESNLWNFETDYVQSAVVNLYGVWVSEVE